MKVTVQEHEDIIWALEYVALKVVQPSQAARFHVLRMKLKAAYETTCQKVNGK